MSNNSALAKRLCDVLDMPASKYPVVLPHSSELDSFYRNDSSEGGRLRSESSQGNYAQAATCIFFRRGICSKGAECRFAHENSSTTTKYKTEMCKNYQHGHCSFRDKCSFAHGKGELRGQQRR